MSTDHQKRNRGRLFENRDKKKPSQPDMRGECVLEGATYEMTAWKREGQLTVSVAIPKPDKNAHAEEAFRGVFGATTWSDDHAWMGDLEGEGASYTVYAAEEQGKSGAYLSLTFEKLPPKPVAASEPAESIESAES